MADYVKDTGTENKDAELSGTYTKLASEHSLRFGADGEADTLITLSTTASWLVTEVYDVEGVEGDIGYTKWQDDATSVLSDLLAIQAIVDGDSKITNYKIVGCHYDHTEANKASVYRGDQDTAISIKDINIPFTVPASTWKLSDTTLSPAIDELAPIYLLEEPLYEIAGYYWLVNSAEGATTKYYGKLCNASGGTWTTTEVAERYDTVNKTIDLSDGYYVDTGWTPPQYSEWSMSGIYDIVFDVSYEIYFIDYDGDGHADVYLGDSVNPVPSTPTYANIPYTPPSETWKIYEEAPSIIFPTIITYTMGSFT